ncbi:MAG: DUF4352 domain-containing protein [Anaerolineae bacterium]|nr:DUF4352 domain-containing protein [Anaerolineae bacterium]
MAYQQQNPYYPPRSVPEEEYYDYEYEDDDGYDDDPDGDSAAQRILLFISGGCLVFICIGCCLLAVMGLWILDPGSGLLATPIPGSDLGLTFEQPAFPDESVVNDQNVRLRILEVNRNVAVPGVAPVEGQELVVVTIELVNLGEQEISFSESDFILINEFQEAYSVSPMASAVDGALGRGSLAPGEGLEARLVFDLLLNEVNLVLGWEAGRDITPRYIYIE